MKILAERHVFVVNFIFAMDVIDSSNAQAIFYDHIISSLRMLFNPLCT